MHLYFVRHGETDLNRRHIHQSPGTPLSPRGYDQAKSVAEYLRTTCPSLLITSEYTRARETAHIIGVHTGLVPIKNDLFREVVRPSSFFGMPLFNSKTCSYMLFSWLRRYNRSWRYEDAENFSDIESRARRARAFLESFNNTHPSIIVVSHTAFIHCMVSLLCTNTLFSSPKSFLHYFNILRMKNTDIIHMMCAETDTKGEWQWQVVDKV